ncbi:response regulator [Variovorax sp. J22R133]|uniref:response regulator transcription factor n=1 Tax=Variovorax brevis TaxID=3053503 RepID=UPI0025789441|nr:response regulator [Variovorax sp. J22R133]MDM0110905.1 response regulator [Variovorax sp. J22R133]
MANAGALIAVVDDDSGMRAMLGRVLRRAGYEQCAFASGEEFLDSLHTQRPACAIMDIHMPGLSGFEVLTRLQADHLRIPGIFISANEDVALERFARDIGAVRLLHKPFASEDLVRAVRCALEPGFDRMRA